MTTRDTERPARGGHQKTDRLIGWVLVALLLSFLTYLIAGYGFLSEETELPEIYVRQPDDPIPPAKPFIWGSRPKLPQKKSSPQVAQFAPSPSTGSANPAAEHKKQDGADVDESEAEEVYGFFVGPDPDKVKRETVRALKRGEAQIWKSGADRGYVLVSTSRKYENRECRQVSYTLFEGQDQTLSPPSQWCREDGGNWLPG